MNISDLNKKTLERFCEQNPSVSEKILTMGKIIEIQETIAGNLNALSIQLKINGKIKNIVLQRSEGKKWNKKTDQMEPFCEFKIIEFSKSGREKSCFFN